MTITKADVLAVALVGMGAYLHSPLTVVSAVVLYGLDYARVVLESKGKDAEIGALTARADVYEKKLKELEMHVVSVADRAKTILGENY